MRVAFDVCQPAVFHDFDYVFLSFHIVSPVALVVQTLFIKTIGDDEPNIVPDNVTGISDTERFFHLSFSFIIASIGPFGLDVVRVDHV